jgi:hypothetical protein
MMHLEDTVMLSKSGAVVLVKYGSEWDAMRTVRLPGFDLFSSGDVREHVIITIRGMRVDDFGSLFGGKLCA